jgi:protein-tyrosine phosphatase
VSAPVPPPPRAPGRYSIAVVCLGNICRSPVAGSVLRDRVARAGLDRVTVRSAGTGGWHVGEPMDRRAAATLLEAGYDATHRAQRFDPGWFDTCDLILAMDRGNLVDTARFSPAGDRARAEGRLRMFRDFDPVEPGEEVPDPYFGGPDGFDRVLEIVERTADVIVAGLPRP